MRVVAVMVAEALVATEQEEGSGGHDEYSGGGWMVMGAL